ncbi:MAG: hypothetical protein KUG81_00385 [Gammaproteobacteria bacterium]|nr:hypothetical protein [Gammaproteobacteria bacterium]
MNSNGSLLSIRALSVCALFGLLLVSGLASGETESPGAQSWRTLDQLTPWERERIDLSTNKVSKVIYWLDQYYLYPL